MSTRATCDECGKPAQWQVARVGTEDWVPSCTKHVGLMVDRLPRKEGGLVWGLP